MMIVWLVSAGLLGLHAVSGLPQSTPDTSSRAPDQSKASGQGWSLAATLLAGSSILYNVKNGIDNFSRRRAHVQRTKAALGRQRQRLNDKFSAKLQRFGTEMEAWRNGQALANNGIDGVTGRLSLVEQKLNGVDNDVTQLAMMHDEVDARTDALQKVGRHEKSLVVKSRDGEYHLAADPALDRCLQGIMEAMLYTVVRAPLNLSIPLFPQAHPPPMSVPFFIFAVISSWLVTTPDNATDIPYSVHARRVESRRRRVREAA
jgi:hypothetical protein